MFGLTYNPDILRKLLEVMAAITAGGLTLWVAAWIVLQALKKEIPALRRYMVRTVIGLALALVLTYLVMPILFVGIVATILVAALILGADATIKKMAGKNGPPDRPAT